MASYIPTDLSTLGANRTAVAPNNVFVAQVTEMDENGCFQLSYCEMFEKQMLECAETIILEVNPQFRRVRGGPGYPHLPGFRAVSLTEGPLHPAPG